MKADIALDKIIAALLMLRGQYFMAPLPKPIEITCEPP